MTIDYEITFSFALPLPPPVALDFVRDVKASLKHVAFLKDISVTPGGVSGEGRLVRASLPINAALFGQHDLSFKSWLLSTPRGARLEGLPLGEDKAGWAEVSGEAEVWPHLQGSRVDYAFSIVIHLDLPAPEKWGGRALLKMIELTARTVLAGVTEGFPQAVQQAAEEVSRAYCDVSLADEVYSEQRGR